MEDERDVVVNATISLGARAGVLIVCLEARRKGAQDNGEKVAGYQGEWPNANVISWPAFLFRSYVQLSRLVEDSLRDMWEEENKADDSGPSATK